MSRAYSEMRYHLMMVRSRLHAVEDKVARASIDNRLENLESFIAYLQTEALTAGRSEPQWEGPPTEVNW